MPIASRSLATALWGVRSAADLLPSRYTTWGTRSPCGSLLCGRHQIVHNRPQRTTLLERLAEFFVVKRRIDAPLVACNGWRSYISKSWMFECCDRRDKGLIFLL